MALLPLSPDELLTTTRAVRKRLDFDRPVERSVIEECLQIAIQAPTGSNLQRWHFVVVTDQAKRRAIAELYRKSWANYLTSPTAATNLRFDDPTRDKVQQRVGESAQYLADHLERAPVFLVPCFVGRIDGQPSSAQAGTWGSILPAVWSFKLAARRPQFFWPMALHRALRSPALARGLESFAAQLGLTRRFGSPVLFRAEPRG